jgi:hypothetical protein
MMYRPRKDMHFSRRAMGLVFLGCGLLLTSVHYLAGLPLLLLAAVFLYYAPRWDLRIEIGASSLRFSENLVDAGPVEISLADLSEVRKVMEDSGRKDMLTGHPQYMEFVEFVTRDGRIWRMHDVFPEAFDEALAEAASGAGAQVKDFGN